MNERNKPTQPPLFDYLEQQQLPDTELKAEIPTINDDTKSHISTASTENNNKNSIFKGYDFNLWKPPDDLISQQKKSTAKTTPGNDYVPKDSITNSNLKQPRNYSKKSSLKHSLTPNNVELNTSKIPSHHLPSSHYKEPIKHLTNDLKPRGNINWGALTVLLGEVGWVIIMGITGWRIGDTFWWSLILSSISIIISIAVLTMWLMPKAFFQLIPSDKNIMLIFIAFSVIVFAGIVKLVIPALVISIIVILTHIFILKLDSEPTNT